MNKFLVSTIATLTISGTAFAHSGHTEMVDGHAHTLVDLAFMGAAPVAIGLAMIAVVLFARGRKS